MKKAQQQKELLTMKVCSAWRKRKVTSVRNGTLPNCFPEIMGHSCLHVMLHSNIYDKRRGESKKILRMNVIQASCGM